MINKKKIIILIASLSIVTLFGFSVIYTIKSHPRYYNKLKSYIKRNITEEKIRSSNNSSLKNDNYALHRKVAKSGDVPLINDNDDITNFLKEGKLVKVKEGVGFKIHKLTHSKAVLSKKSYNVLKEIGSNFNKNAGGDQYFTITSLTRTIKAQKRLTKSNINATKNISTHSYGASFDISYIRFNGRKGRNKKLKTTLEEILISLQKKEKIYVIYERTSNCYHITSR